MDGQYSDKYKGKNCFCASPKNSFCDFSKGGGRPRSMTETRDTWALLHNVTSLCGLYQSNRARSTKGGAEAESQERQDSLAQPVELISPLSQEREAGAEQLGRPLSLCRSALLPCSSLPSLSASANLAVPVLAASLVVMDNKFSLALTRRNPIPRLLLMTRPKL